MPQVRQLAAIMFTDIVGYTAMMGSDEAKAFATLNRNRELHKSAIAECGGSYLKEIGDGTLASFSTVSDAVACAKMMQEICEQEAKISLRIGIHQGEVVFEDGDVFGDGVNIASRIESIAPPGGIYVSESVARNVANKPGFEAKYVGEKELKNVKFPIKVYEILVGGIAKSDRHEKVELAHKHVKTTRHWSRIAAIIILMAVAGFLLYQFFGPQTQSMGHKTIAVLPFENMSPDEENAFFATGVHDDILNKLAGLKELKVISRTSVMGYAGHSGNLRKIGDRLGARYIVEGSVRRAGKEVRVTAALVDANTDQTLWSGSYDRQLENIFSMQSAIAQEIAVTLQATISRTEQAKLDIVPTVVMEAYDNYLKARTILYSSWIGYKQIMEAIGFLEQATDIDPNFVDGWALLSQAHSRRLQQVEQYDDREEERKLAAALARETLDEAIELNSNASSVYIAEGYYYAYVEKDPLSATSNLQKALEINPSDAITHFLQGFIYLQMGAPEKSLKSIAAAYELDKRNGLVIYFLTFAYEINKQYAEMVPFFERLLELEPERTHYGVQAKYYQFLADGTIESFRAFEEAVYHAPETEQRDDRSIQNNLMVVAMFEGDFETYEKAWVGMWDRHHASHGNWSCPAQLNDEANHAHLQFEYGNPEVARNIVQQAKSWAARPINEMSLCIFDRAVYEPKLDIMSGDSTLARKKFDEAVLEVLQNDKFPRGAVEKSVILETADMVAPDRVYGIYRKIAESPVSFVSMESVCANPWTYPNLIRDPQFIEEVKRDGRFVEFLQQYGLVQEGV